MKKQILKLRAEGKSYRKIVEILGCSKSTVAYHCGDGQKAKFFARRKRNYADVMSKLKLEYGGQCRLCGYNRCLKALQFHHTDPSVKESNVSQLVRNASFARLKAEAQKCVLLCSICHTEIHEGLRTL